MIDRIKNWIRVWTDEEKLITKYKAYQKIYGEDNIWCIFADPIDNDNDLQNGAVINAITWTDGKGVSERVFNTLYDECVKIYNTRARSVLFLKAKKDGVELINDYEQSKKLKMEKGEVAKLFAKL